MPKDIVVIKKVSINKNQQEVFDYLKVTRNQEKFSVWNMADPRKKVSVLGDDASVGFKYSWDSEKKSVGKGSQEIKKIVPLERIEYEMIFEKPMKNIGYSHFNISSKGPNQTEVEWGFNGPTKFPMSWFRGMFQRMLGKDIQKSLDNLKSVLEK